MLKPPEELFSLQGSARVGDQVVGVARFKIKIRSTGRSTSSAGRGEHLVMKEAWLRNEERSQYHDTDNWSCKEEGEDKGKTPEKPVGYPILLDLQ